MIRDQARRLSQTSSRGTSRAAKLKFARLCFPLMVGNGICVGRYVALTGMSIHFDSKTYTLPTRDYSTCLQSILRTDYSSAGDFPVPTTSLWLARRSKLSLTTVEKMRSPFISRSSIRALSEVEAIDPPRLYRSIPLSTSSS
jgi:hypothetical protein